MSSLQLEFVDNEITAWGGLAVLKKLMDRSGFLTFLETLPLPPQGSNRGFSPIQLVTQFMASLWCGANRYSHLDVSRFDTTIQKLFGWKDMPEHKAFQRYFQKFSTYHSNKVFGELYRWFFSNLAFDNFTLDIDSSVLTRYRDQETSCKGYNRHKPGRNFWHHIDYVVAVPMYPTLQRKISCQLAWMKLDHGIEVSEFEYQADDWEKARRMVTVRQKIEQRPNAVGKQLSLFDENVDIYGYRYTCYITSMKLSAAEVWRLYRCGNC